MRAYICVVFTAAAISSLAQINYPFEGLQAGPIVGQDNWQAFIGSDLSNYRVDTAIRSPLDGSTQSLRIRGNQAGGRIIRSFANPVSSGTYRVSYDIYFLPLDVSAPEPLIMRVVFYTGDVTQQMFAPTAQNDGDAPGPRQTAYANPLGNGSGQYQQIDIFSGFRYTPNKWYRFTFLMNFGAHTVSDFRLYDISSGSLVDAASDPASYYFRFNLVTNMWVPNFGTLGIGFEYAEPTEGFNIDNFKMAPPAVTVNPTTTSLSPGIVVSGLPSDMYTSNDMYYVLRPGIVLSSQQSPIVLNLSGSAPGANPSQLNMVVESKADQSNVRETIEVYNFSTAAYEVLNQTVLTTSDVVKDLAIPSPANHVGPGNEVRTRISYKAAGPILTYPWRVSIDEATWRYTP